MTKKPCTHEYLANNDTGKVLMCKDCGVVHLHLQNLSMRFDTEQFTALASLMTAASKTMQAESQQALSGPPALTVVH
jgi:hypothetical protein